MKKLAILGLAIALTACGGEPVEEAVETKAKAEAEQVVESDETTQAMADFGITTDKFVSNYNTMMNAYDSSLNINAVEKDGTITFEPMPDYVAMSGVLADNGKLRGLILGISGSNDPNHALNLVAITASAANAVKSDTASSEVSSAVTEIIPAAVQNEGTSQKRVIGNAKYAALNSPALGGVIFTIDAVEE